jgi:hypothetical protein
MKIRRGMVEFHGSHHGAELDLLLVQGDRRIGVCTT